MFFACFQNNEDNASIKIQELCFYNWKLLGFFLSKKTKRHYSAIRRWIRCRNSQGTTFFDESDSLMTDEFSDWRRLDDFAGEFIDFDNLNEFDDYLTTTTLMTLTTFGEFNDWWLTTFFFILNFVIFLFRISAYRKLEFSSVFSCCF